MYGGPGQRQHHPFLERARALPARLVSPQQRPGPQLGRCHSSLPPARRLARALLVALAAPPRLPLPISRAREILAFGRLSGHQAPALFLPRFKPAEAGRPGQPRPVLRKLRSASPARAPADGGVVHTGPRSGPVEDSASFGNRAPRRACHGSHGQSAGGSGWPFGPSSPFFPGPIYG